VRLPEPHDETALRRDVAEALRGGSRGAHDTCMLVRMRNRLKRPTERRRRLRRRTAEREDLKLGRRAPGRGRRRTTDGDRQVLLAVDREKRPAARDLVAGLERPEHLAGAQVESAQDAVATAGETKPAVRRGDTTPLRLGRRE